jgi:hypothetical protein
VHILPEEDSFCDECGKAKKPVIVEDYSWHKGYVDKGERMTNSYSIRIHGSRQNNYFFHLLDLIILKLHHSVSMH